MTPDQEALERVRAQLQVDLETFKSDLQKINAAELARVEAHYKHYQQTVDAHFNHQQQIIERETQWLTGSNRAMVDIGLAALRAIFLANGGAAVALLAFLGSLWQTRRANSAAIVTAMKPAMAYFVTGIGIAVLTAGIAYVGQHYIVLRRDRLSTALRWITIGVGLVSLGAFCLGALRATDAFQIVPQPSSSAAVSTQAP